MKITRHNAYVEAQALITAAEETAAELWSLAYPDVPPPDSFRDPETPEQQRIWDMARTISERYTNTDPDDAIEATAEYRRNLPDPCEADKNRLDAA